MISYDVLVKVIDRKHKMYGRVGRTVPPIKHESAIKLRPDENWVEMIGNDGDKFYGRYKDIQLTTAND